MTTTDTASETKTSTKRRFTTRDTVLVAMFAALIAALGLVPPITIGVIPVPITLQTLGVMLAGAILGPVRGMLASLTIVVLALAGLPLLSGGRGGFGVLLGPSGGYLIGWILGALVIGLLVHKWAIKRSGGVTRFIAVLVSILVGGVGVIYLFGVPWTAVVTGLGLGESAIGSLVFIPGDAIKAVIATIVTVSLHRSYKRLWTNG